MTSYLLGCLAVLTLCSICTVSVIGILYFRSKRQALHAIDSIYLKYRQEHEHRLRTLMEKVKEFTGAEGDAAKSRAEQLLAMEQKTAETLVRSFALKKTQLLSELERNLALLSDAYCALKPQFAGAVTPEKHAALESELAIMKDATEEIFKKYMSSTTHPLEERSYSIDEMRSLVRAHACATPDAAHTAVHMEEEPEDISLSEDTEAIGAASDEKVAEARSKQQAKLQTKLTQTSRELLRATKLLNVVFKEYTAMFGIDTGGKSELTIDEIEAIMKK